MNKIGFIGFSEKIIFNKSDKSFCEKTLEFVSSFLNINKSTVTITNESFARTNEGASLIKKGIELILYCTLFLPLTIISIIASSILRIKFNISKIQIDENKKLQIKSLNSSESKIQIDENSESQIEYLDSSESEIQIDENNNISEFQTERLDPKDNLKWIHPINKDYNTFPNLQKKYKS